MLFAIIDPYILAFSSITVIVTIWMGFRSAKTSKTASDFFVAGRSVSVGWNASAISGEYLSAASFMGIAGMVMSSGYDALWYPVCYACGYLFLLLFIAGPLRRFGAYTIPDFAEGRYDSPLFRKIAVCFVLFIGFFYTMPQMKGAGTTLAYIFPGLPYWAGVVLVGAVITLNVALGGMKGITLVQAVQYWVKMFAISVPIFVLMAVYGFYNQQINLNNTGNNIVTASTMPADEELVKKSFFIVTATPSKTKPPFPLLQSVFEAVNPRSYPRFAQTNCKLVEVATTYMGYCKPRDQEFKFYYALELAEAFRFPTNSPLKTIQPTPTGKMSRSEYADYLKNTLATNGISLVDVGPYAVKIFPTNKADHYLSIPVPLTSQSFPGVERKPLPEKAPTDSTWLSPFGAMVQQHPGFLTNFVSYSTNSERKLKEILPHLQSDAALKDKAATVSDWLNAAPAIDAMESRTVIQAIGRYNAVTRHTVWVENSLTNAWMLNAKTNPAYGLKRTMEQARQDAEAFLDAQGISLVPLADNEVAAVPKNETERFAVLFAAWSSKSAMIRKPLPEKAPADATWVSPFGPLTTKAAKAAKLSPEEAKPYSLLYTYSLIIALVCGTAGLPHILVRFYTNPDGGAAKRTTMWVMILIGIFYVFPPVFGVMGRNLFPELYNGIGAKGTDKIVLELPRLLNDKYAPLGSILSGITCAGAFAAFMSTFSGLLVSMTGALAHDVYGRMLRPKSTSAQRMRMFKFAAILLGGVAVVLGSFVEPLEINFMVGQAFAIAAASYFPLLFMSVWWRGMTMRGAAVGMLTGGLCALVAATLTNVSNLALDKGPMGKIFAGFAGMNDFWAHHPLLRILCEQPAIWTVPLAIGLMIVVSKATRKDVPSDVRMKMLVLHAPEKLGLKQEYIQEHQHGH